MKLESPKLCFVAPIFNVEATLCLTISSLRETATSDFERKIPIYLLDGGSTDSTRYISFGLSRKYSNIYFISRDGEHPGARMNWFIENCKEDVAMIFHADDLYNSSARVSVAMDMLNRGAAACGSQCNYLQSPSDAIKNVKMPLCGTHNTYPLGHKEICQSLNFWWAISLNTLAIDIALVRASGVRYDHYEYKYCADYYFNYQLSASCRVYNSPRVTTLTSQSSTSDGYSNVINVFKEAQHIRRVIRSSTGLSAWLGPRHESVIDTLCYDQTGFTAVLGDFKHSHSDYFRLAARLFELSQQCKQFSRVGPYAKAVAEMAIKLD